MASLPCAPGGDRRGATVAGFADALCLRFSWPLVEPFTEAHVLGRFDAQEEARLRGEELDFAVVDATDVDRVWGGVSLYEVELDEARAAVGSDPSPISWTSW